MTGLANVRAASGFGGILLTWPEGPVPALGQTERALIRLALVCTESRAQAAELLGLRREQLRSRMRRYGLTRETKAVSP